MGPDHPVRHARRVSSRDQQSALVRVAVQKRRQHIYDESRTVTLEDGLGFHEWAREEWPSPRSSVELDPWQLARDWSGSAKSLNARRPTGGVTGGAATSSAAEVNGSLAPRCWRFDPRSAGKTDSRATASR